VVSALVLSDIFSALGLYCSALAKNPPDTSVCDPNQDEDFFGKNIKIADYAYQLISGRGQPFTFGHVSGGSRSTDTKRSELVQEPDE
jgi:hypothetical protein